MDLVPHSANGRRGLGRIPRKLLGAVCGTDLRCAVYRSDLSRRSDAVAATENLGRICAGSDNIRRTVSTHRGMPPHRSAGRVAKSTTSASDECNLRRVPGLHLRLACTRRDCLDPCDSR